MVRRNSKCECESCGHRLYDRQSDEVYEAKCFEDASDSRSAEGTVGRYYTADSASRTFEYMLPEITAEVVSTLMERRGMPEDEAISRFMRSRVYECLQNETSKAWHYSPLLLSQLYEDDLRGELVWPEVA